MFRPKKMKMVRIFVLKSKVESLIKDLHEAGIMDITKSEYEGLEDGRPLSNFDEVSAELLKLRTIYGLLEPYAGRKAGQDGEMQIVPGNAALAETRQLDIDERLRKLNDSNGALAERIRGLENDVRALEIVSHFKQVDFSKLNTRTLDFKVGEVLIPRISGLRESLENFKGHATLVSEQGSSIVLILFEKKKQAAVETMLSGVGFEELQLPAGTTTPVATLKERKDEIGRCEAGIKDMQKDITGIAREHVSRVRLLIRSLEVEADRASVATRFSSSKCVYVLDGWVLEEDFEKLRSITQNYGPAAMLTAVPFGPNQMPPTVLDNPSIAHPMEFVTKSYSMPNYFELDPTIAYLVALPLVYGMIVGDVIYGILSFIIASLFLKKFAGSYLMSNVAKIWMYSAIPSIVFGVLFDEYGGLGHAQLINDLGKWVGIQQVMSEPLYHGFHRMDNVLMLVAITSFLGMIHIALGFLAGAINEWEHSRKHAIGKLAWIGVEIGMLMALLPFISTLLPGMEAVDSFIALPGMILLAISTVVVAVTEGVVGIVEIPGLVGNILSYTRIAAIGIVGVVIAELVNEYFMPLPQQGLMALALAPIFIGLHILNCFIAMFESLIQGGRLNIVEFRSKFLQGGGGIFMPFALYSKKV